MRSSRSEGAGTNSFPETCYINCRRVGSVDRWTYQRRHRLAVRTSTSATPNSSRTAPEALPGLPRSGQKTSNAPEMCILENSILGIIKIERTKDACLKVACVPIIAVSTFFIGTMRDSPGSVVVECTDVGAVKKSRQACGPALERQGSTSQVLKEF